jgi:hypothetical protein
MEVSIINNYVYFSRKIFFFFFYQDLNNGYKVVENPIKICQAVSIIEIIHPLIGFTKGDWSSPLLQVNKTTKNNLN